MSHNHRQNIKIAFISLMSVVGSYYYIVGGGTLTKASLLLVVFFLMTKISTLGYHRWLAHNLIEPGVFGRTLILWCMVSTFLSKPLHYVVGHRLHHKFSDSDKDPHHTRLGFWRFLVGSFNSTSTDAVRVPFKDVYRKKDVMFVDKYFNYLYVLNLVCFWFIDKDVVLLSFLLLNLRTWIGTAIFNYSAHGGVKLQTPVNMLSPFRVFLYAGEHLHKNHHEDPSAANFGKLTSNFDATYFLCKHLTKVKN